MPAEYPLWNFVIAFFFSVTIHLFLALLFWKATTNRTAVEPGSSSIDKTLIVSLITLPVTSNDRLDQEEDLSVLHTDQNIQHSQLSPERKSGAEIVVISKLPDIQASETHKVKPLVNDITLSFEQESLYSMEWNFGIKPVFKVKGIEPSIGQGVQSSRASEGNSLSAYLTPSYGLNAVNRFEQVFREISEAELQLKKIEWRVDYIKKYEASLPPDCTTYYMKKSFNGLFAIPLIIKDAISDSDKACTW
jgi:hypothetical protein